MIIKSTLGLFFEGNITKRSFMYDVCGIPSLHFPVSSIHVFFFVSGRWVDIIIECKMDPWWEGNMTLTPLPPLRQGVPMVSNKDTTVVEGR